MGCQATFHSRPGERSGTGVARGKTAFGAIVGTLDRGEVSDEAASILKDFVDNSISTTGYLVGTPATIS
jgi:hypothetical protein